MNGSNNSQTNPFLCMNTKCRGEQNGQVSEYETCLLCDEPLKTKQKEKRETRCILCEADIGGGG